jgi:hypothetical protein
MENNIEVQISYPFVEREIFAQERNVYAKPREIFAQTTTTETRKPT